MPSFSYGACSLALLLLFAPRPLGGAAPKLQPGKTVALVLHTGLLSKARLRVPARTQRLILRYRRLRKVEGLEKLKQLRALFLDNNDIGSLKWLPSMPHLRKLDVSSNRLRKIGALERIPQLRFLALGYNQLIEIKGIEKLVHLEKLWLSSNKITQIQGLEKLGQLRMLFLSETCIKRLPRLQALPHLWFVDLRNINANLTSKAQNKYQQSSKAGVLFSPWESTFISSAGCSP